MSAAAELDHVGLADALELALLLARERDEGRFRRAALRWHGRYCHELRLYEPCEAQATLALLFMLAGPSATPAAQALAALLEARTFGRAAEILMRWIDSRA
jgi:hypothetical protein